METRSTSVSSVSIDGRSTRTSPSTVCNSVTEAADTQYSYVMVATKAVPDLIQTSKILESLLSPDYVAQFSQPTYVLLQNGLNVEVDLYNSLKGLGMGEPSIISTAVWILTNLLAPNVVEHSDYVSLSLEISLSDIAHFSPRSVLL
jgi:2-dehydropantoate 2-reductase